MALTSTSSKSYSSYRCLASWSWRQKFLFAGIRPQRLAHTRWGLLRGVLVLLIPSRCLIKYLRWRDQWVKVAAKWQSLRPKRPWSGHWREFCTYLMHDLCNLWNCEEVKQGAIRCIRRPISSRRDWMPATQSGSDLFSTSVLTSVPSRHGQKFLIASVSNE